MRWKPLTPKIFKPGTPSVAKLRGGTDRRSPTCVFKSPGAMLGGVGEVRPPPFNIVFLGPKGQEGGLGGPPELRSPLRGPRAAPEKCKFKKFVLFQYIRINSP